MSKIYHSGKQVDMQWVYVRASKERINYTCIGLFQEIEKTYKDTERTLYSDAAHPLEPTCM